MATIIPPKGFGSGALDKVLANVDGWYEVTTLNDGGAGSLREACQQSRKIVVFRVSGAINLNSAIPIAGTDLLIAGETAPGPGINLHGHFLRITGSRIVVRHLRTRVGERNFSRAGSGENADGLQIEGNRVGSRTITDILIDHCEFAWSIDEMATVYFAPQERISFHNCIFGPPLYQSTHPKGSHAFGPLIGTGGAGNIDPSARTKRIDDTDYQRCLFFCHTHRNPRMADNVSCLSSGNVIFGWKHRAFDHEPSGGGGDPAKGPSFLTCHGNVFVAARGWTEQPAIIYVDGRTHAGTQIHMAANTVRNGATNAASGGGTQRLVGAPHANTLIDGKLPPLIPEADLVAEIRLNCGARPKAGRDAVSQRIVNDIAGDYANWKFDLPNTAAQFGGYPNLAQATRASWNNGAGARPAATDRAAVRAWLAAELAAVQHEGAVTGGPSETVGTVGRGLDAVVTAPPRLYATDFRDAVTGSLPSGWQVAADFTAAWTVQSVAGAVGGKVLRQSDTPVRRKHLLWTDVPRVADVEGLVKVRLTAPTADSSAGLVLRWHRPETTADTFVLSLHAGTHLRLAKYVAGPLVVIQDVPFAHGVNTWYWLRFRVNGTSLRGRVWADGQAEPATWAIDRTDSDVANPGQVGLFSYDGSAPEYDVVAFATGGGTAAPSSGASSAGLNAVLTPAGGATPTTRTAAAGLDGELSSSHFRSSFYAETATPQAAGGDWTDYLALHYAPEASTTYWLVAAAVLGGEAAGARAEWRVVDQDAAVRASGSLTVGDPTDAVPVFAIDRVATSASPGMARLVLQLRAPAAARARAIQGALLLLKAHPDDRFSKNDSRQSRAEATFATAAGLDLTPASDGDYAILASAVAGVGDGAPATAGVQVRLWNGAFGLRLGYHEAVRDAADRLSAGIVKRFSLSAGTTVPYALQWASVNGGAAEIREARLLALRLDGFPGWAYTENLAETVNGTAALQSFARLTLDSAGTWAVLASVLGRAGGRWQGELAVTDPDPGEGPATETVWSAGGAPASPSSWVHHGTVFRAALAERSVIDLGYAGDGASTAQADNAGVLALLVAAPGTSRGTLSAGLDTHVVRASPVRRVGLSARLLGPGQYIRVIDF